MHGLITPDSLARQNEIRIQIGNQRVAKTS